MLKSAPPRLRSTLATALVCLALVHPAGAAPCDAPGTATVDVVINDAVVVRRQVPPALFGFNLPWRDFQIGFWRNGEVRPELVALLKPFAGASYRYPGGTPSNSFDWSMSRGDMATRQPVHADYGRRAKVEFGLTEFAAFLKAVDGVALLTANLTGTGEQAPPLDVLKSDADAFARQVLAEFDWPCKAGAPCRLQALELGNELDWPPHRLSGSAYAERAQAFRKAAGPQFPGVPWIAAGRTAPWERKGEVFDDFNRAVLSGMAPGLAGLAIHPYYDGLAVSDALDYVRRYGDAVQRSSSAAGVYVTEHARWPAKPLVGEWQQNWYTTTSMGGALATADFMLGLLPMPLVKSANWHALSAAGPWQLVRVDPATDRLVPTALYWAFRLLREQMLSDVVQVQYSPTNTAGYGGRYDQRLLAMASGAERRLLGINRARTPVMLKLSGNPQAAPLVPDRLDWVGAAAAEAQNTPAAPDTVRPRGEVLSAESGARVDGRVCIPPLSVFAVTIRR